MAHAEQNPTTEVQPEVIDPAAELGARAIEKTIGADETLNPVERNSQRPYRPRVIRMGGFLYEI